MEKQKEDQYLRQEHGDDLADKVIEIRKRLAILEIEYQKDNPNFEMRKMWIMEAKQGSPILFNTTSSCTDPTLVKQIIQVFKDVLSTS